jgi:hypothetical protein
LRVGEPDTDDFDDARAFGVCHTIDRGARHKIGSDERPANQGLEAVCPWFWVLNVCALENV